MAAGFSAQDVRLLRRLGAHVMKLLQAACNPMLLAANDDIDVDAEGKSWSKVWELLREIARSDVPGRIAKDVDLDVTGLTKSPENKILISASFIQIVRSH